MILNNITKLTCLLFFLALLSACGGEGAVETTYFTVSTSVGVGGEINPTTVTVSEGGYADLSIIPIDGFSIASVSGCGGSRAGNTYTTAAVVADCTVTASFDSVIGDLTISGLVTFDHIPTSTTSGLDYAAQTAKPARGVVVEAIRVSDDLRVGLAATDATGAYSMTVPAATNITIRVKAQMLTTGALHGIFRWWIIPIVRRFMRCRAARLIRAPWLFWIKTSTHPLAGAVHHTLQHG